jgi:TPR repeat protein
VGLAECLQAAVGCPADLTRAVELFTSATQCEEGDATIVARAHQGLGRAFAEGWGVDADEDAAKEHWRLGSRI